MSMEHGVPQWLNRLDLTEVIVQREMLIDIAEETDNDCAIAFFQSLEQKKMWSADALLRYFEDSTEYEAQCQRTEPPHIFALQRAIKDVIIQCAAQEVRRKRCALNNSEKVPMGSVQRRIDDIAMNIADEVTLTTTLKYTLINLEEAHVSVPRLAAIIKSLRLKRETWCAEELQRLEAQNTGNQKEQAVIQTWLEKARRTQLLTDMLFAMSEENILRTDLAFLVPEVNARLHELYPEFAEQLMEQCVDAAADVVAQKQLETIRVRGTVRENLLSQWKRVVHFSLEHLLTSRRENMSESD